MILDRVKKLLGISELEKRTEIAENKNRDLEMRVIQGTKAKELILSAAKTDYVANELTEHINNLSLEITPQTMPQTMAALEAVEIVERYGFKRYAPPITEALPSRIISLQEFKDHPEKYIHKIAKGFLGYPLGLNFDNINQLLFKNYGNLRINDKLSKDGKIQFILGSIVNTYTREVDIMPVTNALMKAAELSRLQLTNSGDWIDMEPQDFLANQGRLERFIEEHPALTEEQKKKGISAFRLAKEIYLSAAEIVGTTKIVDPSELLKYQGNEPIIKPKIPENPNEKLTQIIIDTLTTEMQGTTYLEIQKLLPIRSIETFRELASKRTNEILLKDQKYKGLTKNIDKPLNEYTPMESVLLACYFARNIITKYEILEDGVKRILRGKDTEEITGKCTDFTGLALQYLREYLIPLQPEKFNNWTFGFDSDIIGDYKHCYLKIMHKKPDQSYEVTFIDPTRLANSGLNDLSQPSELIKKLEMNDSPILINRDAEDLMYKPLQP